MCYMHFVRMEQFGGGEKQKTELAGVNAGQS